MRAIGRPGDPCASVGERAGARHRCGLVGGSTGRTGARVSRHPRTGSDASYVCTRSCVWVLLVSLRVSLHQFESEVVGARCLDRTFPPQFDSLRVEILEEPDTAAE